SAGHGFKRLRGRGLSSVSDRFNDARLDPDPVRRYAVRVWNKRGFGLFLCAYALSLLAMQACSNDDDEAESRPHADGGESDTNVEDVTVAADAAGADAPHDAK